MRRPLRILTLAAAVGLLACTAPAADDSPAKGIKKLDVSVTPAEAKPGQTVTVKITVELEDGFHTYPTKQADKNAESYVSKITFPDTGDLIYVGDVKDPPNAETKAEPEAGIKELRQYSGILTYERKAVVSPKAAAGNAAVKLKAVRLTVCDEKNCYPPKTLTPETTLKVSGAAVAVEKQYEDDVKKAIAEKK